MTGWRVDLDEARVVLGVGPDDEWGAVQSAYRRLIRVAHPDRAGPAGNLRAARLNEAYTVLSHARRSRIVGTTAGTHSQTSRQTRPSRPRARTTRANSATSGVHIGDPADGADTLLLHAPPDQAFMRLLEASDELGEISYADRSSGVFEVIVPHDGETCSLLIIIEHHRHGAVAYCALESLERVASPSATSIVHRLAAALRSG